MIFLQNMSTSQSTMMTSPTEHPVMYECQKPLHTHTGRVGLQYLKQWGCAIGIIITLLQCHILLTQKIKLNYSLVALLTLCATKLLCLLNLFHPNTSHFSQRDCLFLLGLCLEGNKQLKPPTSDQGQSLWSRLAWPLPFPSCWYCGKCRGQLH